MEHGIQWLPETAKGRKEEEGKALIRTPERRTRGRLKWAVRLRWLAGDRPIYYIVNWQGLFLRLALCGDFPDNAPLDANHNAYWLDCYPCPATPPLLASASRLGIF